MTEETHPTQGPSASNRPMPAKEQVQQPLDETQVSGTDIVGDETNVRTVPGVKQPGIADHIPPQAT